MNGCNLGGFVIKEYTDFDAIVLGITVFDNKPKRTKIYHVTRKQFINK
jgi:hypothetical protein